MDTARDMIGLGTYEKKEYTREDILALPEGQRAEIIGGIWYDMATPGTIHQRLVTNIARSLGNYIEKKGGDCEVFVSPFAVFLTESQKDWFEPDVVVVCDKDKIQDDGCHGAPDLVVEVASKSTRKKDMGVKLFRYQAGGVREYWIVNPDEEITYYYHFDGDIENVEMEQVNFDEELICGLYPDFTIRIGEFM